LVTGPTLAPDLRRITFTTGRKEKTGAAQKAGVGRGHYTRTRQKIPHDWPERYPSFSSGKGPLAKKGGPYYFREGLEKGPGEAGTFLKRAREKKKLSPFGDRVSIH